MKIFKKYKFSTSLILCKISKILPFPYSEPVEIIRESIVQPDIESESGLSQQH